MSDHKIINGERIDLTSEEIAGNDSRRIAATAQAQIDGIEQARQERKKILMNKKLESMLSVEFAEIDAATDKASINSVIIR